MGDAKPKEPVPETLAVHEERLCSICGKAETLRARVYVHNMFTESPFLAHMRCARENKTPIPAVDFVVRAAERKIRTQKIRAAVLAEQAELRAREIREAPPRVRKVREKYGKSEEGSLAQKARRARERQIRFTKRNEEALRQLEDRKRETTELLKALNGRTEGRLEQAQTKKKPVGRACIRLSEIEPDDWIAAYEAADENHQAWMRYAYPSPRMIRNAYGTDGAFARFHPNWAVDDGEQVVWCRYTKMVRIDCGRHVPRAPTLDELDEWEVDTPPNRLYRDSGQT